MTDPNQTPKNQNSERKDNSVGSPFALLVMALLFLGITLAITATVLYTAMTDGVNVAVQYGFEQLWVPAVGMAVIANFKQRVTGEPEPFVFFMCSAVAAASLTFNFLS